MSDMAKQARAAMKAKASRLTTADPHQKVDSSTWTPPDALNTEAKTGLRPISRRAFKKGGKVVGKKPKMNLGKSTRGGNKPLTPDNFANKDVKAANEDRYGIKHVGALKRGGKAMRKGKAGGGYNSPSDYQDENAVPYPDREDKADMIADLLKNDDTPAVAGKGPLTREQAGIKSGGGTPAERAANRAAFEKEQREHQRKMPQNQKSGGKVKKALGGSMAGAKRMLEQGQETSGVPAATMGFSGLKKGLISPARGIGLKKGGTAKHDDVKEDMALIKKMVKPSARKGREDGGGLRQSERTLAERAKRDMLDTRFANQDFLRDNGGPLMHPYDERRPAAAALAIAADKAKQNYDQVRDETGYKKGGKAKRAARKDGGGIFTGPGYPGKVPGVVPGGRTAHAAGGKAGKGKTNINIVIAAGKQPGQDMMGPPPGMDGGAKGMPVPVGPPPGAGGMPMGGGAPPMPMPPMPAPGGAPMGGPPGMPPMPRKSGGRLTAKASSYKDMTAGSAGGEGRLQKTDIAEKHKGAPAFKAGGGVYRSYKDMDAGSASGLGRLEKTEIQKRKG
jgi:hypothetical protein